MTWHIRYCCKSLISDSIAIEVDRQDGLLLASGAVDGVGPFDVLSAIKRSNIRNMLDQELFALLLTALGGRFVWMI